MSGDYCNKCAMPRPCHCWAEEQNKTLRAQLVSAEADLAAANRQLDDCEHGYATLKADLAAANAKLAAKPDVAGLVDAYDEARYHFEDWTGGADTPSKQAELKRRVDAKDAARQRIQDALLSLSAQLAEKEAECEGMRQDAERLDWLDSAESSLVGGSTTDGTIRWGFTTPDPGIEWTLRDAIDAAIAAREP